MILRGLCRLIPSAFFIALRYLLGRAKEGGRYLRGAAAGIALSLVPIVVTLIVADGMIRGITDRFLELGTGHIQVHNFLGDRDPEEALPHVEDLEGVRGAWMERNGLGVILGTGGSRAAMIRAIEPSFWEDEGSMRYLQVLEGEGKPQGNRDILLGDELARSIGAAAGSTIRIMTLQLGAGESYYPRMGVFTVRGIVSSGYRELDALWCIMTYEAGLETLSDTGGAHLLIKIEDPYNGSQAMVQTLYDELGSGYGVFPWMTLQHAQYSSYMSTRQLLIFIMALIVLVAAVNVSSATSMLVIERQRDIAVLKASGARPAFTSSIFLWGAFLTGLTGTILGLSAGLILGVSVNGIIRTLESALHFFSQVFFGGELDFFDSSYYVDTIPILINVPALAVIGICTILSSVLASWIPAHRAGKLRPLDLLRKY
ncbi:MAG: ABC transporter permease [Treponema sp.]|nr:ABC transporter permease [Treponema sp.]